MSQVHDPALTPAPAHAVRRRSTSTVLSAGTHVVRTRSGEHSVAVRRRAARVTVALAAIGIACAVIALTTGDYPIAVSDVVAALLGERDDLADSIVVNWRLPRIAAALLFGSALGASGALFQSLAANPLASPDVMGFSAGAGTGALVVLLITGGGPGTLAAGSLAGGVATALAVYALAYRGGVQGFRLILVGISVSAMLTACNEYLVRQAVRRDDLALEQARMWMVGTLNGISWGRLGPGVIVLAVLIPAALALGRPMRWIEMGDDAAAALGIRLDRVRLGAVIVGVGLTAVVTSLCGPIAFISLAAPQIARRLAHSAAITLPAAMATGAALLAISDLLAQRLLWTELPVGAVTVTIGGGYFVWLLARERRQL